MAKSKPRRVPKRSLKLLREIQSQLSEIDSKIEHLIKSYRKFYFTTDFSDSYKNGFKG
jgi:hypothetical protein